MNLHALIVLLISSGFLGAGLSPVVSVLQQRHWSTRIKTVVTLVAAVAAAAATTYGEAGWHGLTSTTLLAFGASLGTYVVGVFGSYHALWQKLGVTQWIERVTTFARKTKSLYERLSPADRAEIDTWVEARASVLAQKLGVPDPLPAAPDAAPAAT